MKVTKKKAFGAFLVAILCLGLVAPTSALAWNTTTQGNDETTNSQDVEGDTSGESEVRGWIGTLDSEEAPDPEAPDPDPSDWINVTMPTVVLFGSLADDAGVIYSPQYYVYNNSYYPVDVTPTGFEVYANGDSANYDQTEPAELSGMELELNFTTPTLDVDLRTSADDFLGADFTNTTSVNLAAASGGTPTEGNFEINGLLPGGASFSYPDVDDGPFRPVYNLTLTFDAVVS